MIWKEVCYIKIKVINKKKGLTRKNDLCPMVMGYVVTDLMLLKMSYQAVV